MTGSQSLERGLNILKLLSQSPEQMGIREVARRCELSAAIIQRLMNTLEEWGYVSQDEVTKRYKLGHAVLSLAHNLARQEPLLEASLAELRQLAREHHLNGFLGIRRDNRGVYLMAVQSDGPLVVRATPGDTFHLHTTALGKILLAAVDDPELRALLGAGQLEAVTSHTMTNPDRLIAQIRKVRVAGHASSIEENLPGISSIAAPIHDAAGAVIAGISVAYPRLLEPAPTTGSIADLVIAAATRISQQLGFESHATSHQ
ncbi:IclR family transcriptional regulator (plasmid) [Bosea vestrisii]|uniref:IclR family transcriptional regulator n=1 Tax=Bosea vestrisii TaxID=151416 RepID=UPI0024DF9582|nr:IclR family transcriptional regulator [Bosea vestrisii]WID99738.1 IclR family transcriptional regulator [Bosea vestrisii]